mgnify:CR=1
MKSAIKIIILAIYTHVILTCVKGIIKIIKKGI